MKVLLVNGSPHRKGETYNALSLVETSLNEKGIGTEWFWIGNKPAAAVASCMRSGANSTIDHINKYFSFSEMPSVRFIASVFKCSILDQITKNVYWRCALIL